MAVYWVKGLFLFVLQPQRTISLTLMFPGLFKMTAAAALAYSLVNGTAPQPTVASPETEELAEARIFPFNYDRTDPRYDLFLNLADTVVSKKYVPVFAQYKLSFNGETWEAVLHQMMERIDGNTARHIQMQPEDEGVYVSTGDRPMQQKFLREMLPVLSNTMLLERHLQRLDRSRLTE
jgi:hypothetical protein